MSGWRCRLASTADETALLRLHGRPMPGAIRLSALAPSGLRQHLPGERQCVALMENAAGEVLGFGARSVQSVSLAGSVCRVPVLSALRQRPGLLAPVSSWARCYALLAEQARSDEQELALTAILDENVVARRILMRGLRGLPIYQPRCHLETRVWRVPRRSARIPGIDIESFTATDIDELRKLYHHGTRRHHGLPDPETIAGRKIFLAKRNGRVLASLSFWDQRAWRAWRVDSYAWSLRLLRPMWNAWPYRGTRPVLPVAGALCRLAWCSHYLAYEHDDQVTEALLARVQAEARAAGVTMLACGQATDHPLIRYLRRHRPGLAIASTCYSVGAAQEQWPRQDWRPEVACL